MEVKNWTYEEFPDYTSLAGLPEGAHLISTTGNESGVFYIHDVEYAVVDNIPLHLQILVPTSRNAAFSPLADHQPFTLPCFVFVQGSAWMKQYVYAKLAQVAKIALKGYVCAIVEYRHSGQAAFPAQIRDARNAVRFLRKNAARFGIDPAKIILAGDSSGGYTAVWGGMLHDDDSPENLYPPFSADVKGIVDYYGSVSVIAPDSNPCTVNHCRPDSPEGMVMGSRDLLENPELARQLSAECNIFPETQIPPVLIFHGTKDRTVNCSGSVVLYQALKQTGHPAELYLLRGADHGGPEFWTDEVIEIVDAFCRKCLEG